MDLNWLPDADKAEETLDRQRHLMSSAGADANKRSALLQVNGCSNNQLIVVPQLHAALDSSRSPWLKIYHELLAISPSVEAGIVLCQVLYWLDFTTKKTEKKVPTRTKDPCFYHASKGQLVDVCPFLAYHLNGEGELVKRSRTAIEKAIIRIYAQLRDAGYISTKICGRGRGRHIAIIVHVEAIAARVTSFRNLRGFKAATQQASSPEWHEIKRIRESEKRELAQRKRAAKSRD